MGAGGRREPGAREKGDRKKREGVWVWGFQAGAGAVVPCPRSDTQPGCGPKGGQGAGSGKTCRPCEALCRRGTGRRAPS